MKTLLLVSNDGTIRIYGNCSTIKQAKEAGLKTDHYVYFKFNTMEEAKEKSSKIDEYRIPSITIL